MVVGLSIVGTIIMLIIIYYENIISSKTEIKYKTSALNNYLNGDAGVVYWDDGLKFAPTGEEVIRTRDGLQSVSTGKIVYNERDAYIEKSKTWLKQLADNLNVKYIDYGDGNGVVDKNNNKVRLIKNGNEYNVVIKGSDKILETIKEPSKCIYLNGCYARKNKSLNIKNEKINSCDFFKIKY